VTHDPHRKDAEAAGLFLTKFYERSMKRKREVDPDYAYWLARWAAHWAARSEALR
jgi:hypothetical protein